MKDAIIEILKAEHKETEQRLIQEAMQRFVVS